MKHVDEDKLRVLFQKIEPLEPTPDFESRIMQQIRIVDAKKKKRARLWSYVAMAGGVAAMFGLPAILFAIIGWSPDLDTEAIKNYSFGFSSINFNTSILFFPCVIFALLIGDLFIRKHIWDKKQKH